MVLEVCGYNLVDRQLRRGHAFRARVFVINVLRARFLGACPLALIGARALSKRAFSDDPHRFTTARSAFEDESGRSWWTRHRSSISARARSVARSLPSGRVACNL